MSIKFLSVSMISYLCVFQEIYCCESTIASILRLSFVTHETLIKPYISRSSRILFNSDSFKSMASLFKAFTRSESIMLPACFIFSYITLRTGYFIQYRSCIILLEVYQYYDIFVPEMYYCINVRSIKFQSLIQNSLVYFVLAIECLIYCFWHCGCNALPYRFIPVFYIFCYGRLYHM